LLETERLLLRQPTLDDVEAASTWLRDPEVMQHLGGVADDVPAVVQGWIDDWSRYPVGKFLVERVDDHAVVGRVGFNFLDAATWERTTGPGAVPELGWGLARAYWGRGYATEAARACREWLGRDGVVSLIRPGNVRSQHVAERLGAQPRETVLHAGEPHLVWVHPR
jgi:RimJ/RimL family protein N-acetyltransferase